MKTIKKNIGLNILTWILQILVASVFFLVGYLKLTQPIETLATNISWSADVPSILVRLLGIIELIGATGLLFPSLLRINPHYAYCAAWSLCFVMLLAMLFHLFRLEFMEISITILLFSLLYFIGWARHKQVPIVQYKTH